MVLSSSFIVLSLALFASSAPVLNPQTISILSSTTPSVVPTIPPKVISSTVPSASSAVQSEVIPTALPSVPSAVLSPSPVVSPAPAPSQLNASPPVTFGDLTTPSQGGTFNDFIASSGIASNGKPLVPEAHVARGGMDHDSSYFKRGFQPGFFNYAAQDRNDGFDRFKSEGPPKGAKGPLVGAKPGAPALAKGAKSAAKGPAVPLAKGKPARRSVAPIQGRHIGTDQTAPIDPDQTALTGPGIAPEVPGQRVSPDTTSQNATPEPTPQSDVPAPTGQSVAPVPTGQGIAPDQTSHDQETNPGVDV